MAGTKLEEKTGSLLAILRTVERAAEDVVHQAFARLLSSDIHVASAAEAKRLLADHEDTEELTDSIQRFVGIATLVARIALRGARFTRLPWVLVAASAISIGVTVRNGVRELQAIAALLAYRFKHETGVPPDPALLQKLTLELSQAASSSGRVRTRWLCDLRRSPPFGVRDDGQSDLTQIDRRAFSSSGIRDSSIRWS